MQQEQFLLPEGVTVRDDQQNRYVIEGVLGKGQAGAVYLVRERDNEQAQRALKEIIDPDAEDRKRFTFESEVLKRMRHPALPRVYQVFEHDKLKRVYLLMDYIAGKNLEQFLHELAEKRMTLPTATRFMAPIVDALTYLHTQPTPIVHRDVKPANIIVPTRGKNAMLVDFGSAKEYVPGMATKAIVRRSHGYAAPEQYSSGTSPATDIYCLGATFYTLLTGLVPIDASSRVLKLVNANSDPLRPVKSLVEGIPSEVSDAIQRAMALKVSDRFETVQEFWEVFQSNEMILLPQSSSISRDVPETPRPQGLDEREGAREGQRLVRSEDRLLFLLTALIIVLALLLVSGFLFFQAYILVFVLVSLAIAVSALGVLFWRTMRRAR